MSKPVCVVVGVGPGNGAALARRFHAGGYAVALLARSSELTAELARELEGSRPYACDVADEAAVARTFAAIARDLGPVGLAANPPAAVGMDVRAGGPPVRRDLVETPGWTRRHSRPGRTST